MLFRYDFVRVFDGSMALGALSGSALPAPILAPSGVLRVAFMSDGSVEAAGFVATVGRTDAASSTTALLASPTHTCGGVVVAAAASVSSGRLYTPNMRCEWELPAAALTIVVEMLDLEEVNNYRPRHRRGKLLNNYIGHNYMPGPRGCKQLHRP